jgi:hypothetical protein
MWGGWLWLLFQTVLKKNKKKKIPKIPYLTKMVNLISSIFLIPHIRTRYDSLWANLSWMSFQTRFLVTFHVAWKLMKISKQPSMRWECTLELRVYFFKMMST